MTQLNAVDAVAQALARVEADASRAEHYVALSQVLRRSQQCDAAVQWCKTGLKKHPSSRELKAELQEARIAALAQLPSDDEDEDDEEDDDSTHVQTDKDERSAGWVMTGMESRVGISAAFEGSHVPTPSTASTGANPRDNQARGHVKNEPQQLSTQTIGVDMTTRRSDAVVANDDQTLVFDAKVERLLGHLDLMKLVRLGIWYTVLELLQLHAVTGGLVLLMLGLLMHALVHRNKLMVVSIVIICVYRSTFKRWADQRLQQWVNTSSDKLGAVAWLPRVVLALPIAMKLFGNLKFMLFVQRDPVLATYVTLTTGVAVAMTWGLEKKHEHKHWGHGKRLKFIAYTTAILYCAVWQGQYMDTLRRLGAPALIDAGGIVLSSVKSAQLQQVCRRAWKRVFDDVVSDMQQDVELDAWFLLGLSNWVIDYWQQPTTISVEMIVRMLSEFFQMLEQKAVHTFKPELHRLRQQLRELGKDAELSVLMTYLKANVDAIPPTKSLAFAGLFAKRCTSFIVGILLLVFYGSLPPPLLPFLVSEATDARIIYTMYSSDEMARKDGLDVLLHGSPLLHVWKNTKATVRCLGGAVTVTRAMATGAQVAVNAARVGGIARFGARVWATGINAEHAAELPDHLTSAFMIARDYGSIADGVRHVAGSEYVIGIRSAVHRWWRRPAGEAKEDESKQTE